MQSSGTLLHLFLAGTIVVLSATAGRAGFIPVEPSSPLKADVPDRDILAEAEEYCLALAVYFEGGSTGESEVGQRHIARVVVERARANKPKWGGSNLCDVVFYEAAGVCQFSFACLAAARRTPRGGGAWEYSKIIARDEIAGRSSVIVRSIRYYMNAALTSDRNACRFRREFVPVVRAGRHEFFREPVGAERVQVAKADYLECQRHAEAERAKKLKALKALKAKKLKALRAKARGKSKRFATAARQKAAVKSGRKTRQARR
jgi:hypothetical protein